MTQGREDHRTFAASVRMARAALGWSQVELAQRLGMTQRSIHRIEQGHCAPRRTTLLAIESLLRRAGLEISDRADGGFSITVPATVLEGNPCEHIPAPSLSADDAHEEHTIEAELAHSA